MLLALWFPMLTSRRIRIRLEMRFSRVKSMKKLSYFCHKLARHELLVNNMKLTCLYSLNNYYTIKNM